MPGYVYRGTDFTVPRNRSGGRPKTGLAPFNPALCGENRGYHQHYRHGQPQCAACLAAHRAYDADYRARRRAAGLNRRTASRRAA